MCTKVSANLMFTCYSQDIVLHGDRRTFSSPLEYAFLKFPEPGAVLLPETACKLSVWNVLCAACTRQISQLAAEIELQVLHIDCLISYRNTDNVEASFMNGLKVALI